ncbi:hypothetical protein RB200_23385 [Streptomyces sp. PmtG]
MDIGSSGRPRLNVPRAVASSTPTAASDSGDAVLSREKLKKYHQMCASRDGLIVESKQAGLTEVEIAELSGHSRNTVRSILKRYAAP